MATPEGKLKTKITTYLKQSGIYHFRKNQVAGDKKGIPDIIAIDSKGTFIGIEVKAGDNTQSEAQKAQQRGIEKTNGVYLLAYSLQDVKNYFERGD